MSIRATATGVRLALHVQPGAARSEFMGRFGEALKVRLAAPPVDGRANEALLDLVAEVLGVPRRRVSLLRGVSSRRKTVGVEGVDVATATRKLLGSG